MAKPISILKRVAVDGSFEGMTIKPEDVKNALLVEDDFGFELRVGEVFKKAALFGHPMNRTYKGDVDHGGTFSDPSLGKPRQFDYRFNLVQIAGPANEKLMDSIILAVECKNLGPDWPLVISGVRRAEQEAFHTVIETTPGQVGDVVLTKHVKSFLRAYLYAPGNFVGKHILRFNGTSRKPFKSETTADIYDRWSQAVQSASDIAVSVRTAATRNKAQRVRSVILPMVVVPDGVLWKAQYGPNGSIDAEPALTDECTFFIGRTLDAKIWSGHPVPPVLTHIHFLTLTGFARFLENHVSTGELFYSWNRLFPSD